MKKTWTISLLIVTSLIFLNGCDNNSDITAPTDEQNSLELMLIEETIAAFPLDSLSEEEVAGLELMREEEKLARDVYLHLYETWGMKIFNNISNSESTHTYTIKVILDRYDIEDPVTDDTIGEFENEHLLALYNSLTAIGDSSLVQALTVGATIEDLDIYDLLELTKITDNEDILFAYDNLTKGSRNHIRSYVSKLSGYNIDYEAQFIEEGLLDSILSTPKETGNM